MYDIVCFFSHIQAGAIQTSIPGGTASAVQSTADAIFNGKPAPNVSTVTVGSAGQCRPAPSGAITLEVRPTSCHIPSEKALSGNEALPSSAAQSAKPENGLKALSDKGRAAGNIVDDRQRYSPRCFGRNWD